MSSEILIFTDLGVCIVLGVIAWMIYAYVRPNTVFNKYLNAFKIGMLQRAADKEGIKIEENVKKMKRKDIESIIDSKIAEALEINGK